MRIENTLYEEYIANPCEETQDKLYKAIVALSRNIIYLSLHSERMDLATDVAAKVLLSLDSFSGKSEFSTWVYTIAKNIALMEIRRLNIRKEISIEDHTMTHTPLDVGLDGYAAILLEDVSKQFSPIDRQIFERKLFGSSEEEIAKETDLTIAGVHSRWERMRTQVKTFLKRS